MFWLLQYRPKKLDKLILHHDIGDNLSKLVSVTMSDLVTSRASTWLCNQLNIYVHLQVASGDCPHTLFYGPPGAGKKTLILALLREIYGVGAERVCFA